MNYNDFPILNENEYKFLENKYNNKKYFNREENIYIIFSMLNDCINAAPFLLLEVNAPIKDCLIDVKAQLEKINENLTAIFNFKENKKEIKKINLFNFLKNIAILQKNIINWHKNEQKEYFKQFSYGLIETLNDIFLRLTTQLEIANFRLFKFM